MTDSRNNYRRLAIPYTAIDRAGNVLDRGLLHRYCTAAEARRQIIGRKLAIRINIDSLQKENDALTRELQYYKPKGKKC